jgi:hypothetical protein
MRSAEGGSLAGLAHLLWIEQANRWIKLRHSARPTGRWLAPRQRDGPEDVRAFLASRSQVLTA